MLGEVLILISPKRQVTACTLGIEHFLPLYMFPWDTFVLGGYETYTIYISFFSTYLTATHKAVKGIRKSKPRLSHQLEFDPIRQYLLIIFKK